MMATLLDVAVARSGNHRMKTNIPIWGEKVRQPVIYSYDSDLRNDDFERERKHFKSNINL